MISTFHLELSKPSAKLYHVQLLTHQEEFLFGNLSGEQTQLNPSGQIAAAEWQQSAVAHQRDIELELWTVLPNGVRALIAVVNSGSQPSSYDLRNNPPKPPRALSSFVAGFKAAAAKRINLVRAQPGAPVWQRGYKEQRIDDPKTLTHIRHLLTNQSHGAELMPDA